MKTTTVFSVSKKRLAVTTPMWDHLNLETNWRHTLDMTTNLLTTTRKFFISLLILFCSTSAYAHPDGAKPYWYPSSYIFGFIRGCAETVEQNTPQIIEELWPDQIRSVCGCVLDSLRHSFTYHEALSEDSAAMNLIVSATLPICIEEELARKDAD